MCVWRGGGGGYSWGIMPYLYTLGRFLLCVCVCGGGGVFMGYNALPVYPGEVPPVCVCVCGGGGGVFMGYNALPVYPGKVPYHWT